MDPSSLSFRPGYFTHLVTHLHEFETSQREEMATLYGAPSSDASSLAEYWIENPEHVVEVVRSEVETSVGWRLVSEAVIEHDLWMVLDWAPARQRELVSRLGLLNPQLDDGGHWRAVMPGALAAIFSGRVGGQRGSLPVLLGRWSDKEVRSLAAQWDLSEQGSKVEVILRICDHFMSEDMTDTVLHTLPNPDWIGDALMILELGGMCHWQLIYGHSPDEQGANNDKVVPLMRGEDRRKQRDIADKLMELGVIVRFEDDHKQHQMVAVPEELWPGLWKLGRRWLMDWTAQGWASLENQVQGGNQTAQTGLQKVLKWWLCELETSELAYENGDGRDLSAASRDRLDSVYRGQNSVDWDDIWQLGRELQILSEGPDEQLEVGTEAKILIDQRRGDFVREALMEWCLGYTGRRADENITEAIGLDEHWRNRAVALMRRQAEPVPHWMREFGVEPGSTGGGWLRQSGTGPDEIILFEAGLTVNFVMTAKLIWLDLLSLLKSQQRYPLGGLVVLMQCVTGLSMFSQLGLVLEEQPAPIYLPFQRASFLMDQRHQVHVEKWVEDVVQRLLVPLGVATVVDDDTVWLETKMLRIDNPVDWPKEQRKKLLVEILGSDVDFEMSNGADIGIRQVAPAPESDGDKVSVDEPLDRLLEIARGQKVAAFDGRFVEFEPRP